MNRVVQLKGYQSYTMTSVIYTTDHLYKSRAMYIECTLVADSQTNSASTSAPWKVTVYHAYFIYICPFFAPWYNISTCPDHVTIVSGHVCVCDLIIAMRRHQKKERGNRTHFRPTFLPRGINTEIKISVVCCNLFLAVL